MHPLPGNATLDQNAVYRMRSTDEGHINSSWVLQYNGPMHPCRLSAIPTCSLTVVL